MAEKRTTVARDLVLAVLLTAVFMSMLCVTIINVALPSIQRGLSATAADLQWVLAGYSLTFGVLLIPAGRAGDLFGHGRVFVLGVALFTLASVVATAAPSAVVLNLSRVLMGVGAGLFNPQVMGMIQHLYPGQERARAFGIYGAVVSVGAAIGPVIGGALLSWLPPDIGWRATFAINVPFGVFALGLALVWLPRPEARAAGGPRADLDPVAVVLLTAATVCVMLPFIRGSMWLLAAGGLLVAAFVAWERGYAARGRAPMVDLALFRLRSFSVGVTVLAFFYTGTINVYVIQTLFIQQGLGGSALLAGLVSLPPALATGYGSHLGARLLARHRGRVVTWGLLVLLVGLVATIGVMFLIAAGASVWWNAVTMSVLGVGMGAVTSAIQTLTLEDVPVGSGGTAGGIMQTGQRVGSAIGMAIIPGIWFTTFDQGPAPAHAYAYAAIGGFVLIALLVHLLARPKAQLSARQP